MPSNPLSRRRVLSFSLLSAASAVRHTCSSLIAGVLLAGVEQALADTDASQSLVTLDAAEAAEFAAIAARIIPTDETPGATEAGAIYFMDQVLGSSRAELLPVLRQGLAALQADVTQLHGNALFSSLAPDQQDALLRAIEHSEFFTAMRYLTIAGTFSLPQYGGNRGHAGWDMIGFDHRHAWQAPYGYYDADYMQKGE